MVTVVMSLGGVILSGWVVAQQITLPLCPINQVIVWHECIGVMTFPDGEKYIGGVCNGNPHWGGTTTICSGWQKAGGHVGNISPGKGE